MGGCGCGPKGGWRDNAGGVLDECTTNTDHGGQPLEYLVPCPSFIARAKELAAPCTEENSGGIERIRCHGVSQNRLICKFLWQASHEWFPRSSIVSGSIDSQTTVACTAKFVGLNGNDIHAVGVSRVHGHGKTKIRRHSIGNVRPVLAAVVGAIQSPVILQEEAF